jgi:predicted TIM-barrel fold metal-dependent hydrolase
MDMPLSDFRQMSVAEFDTSKLLAHARLQAEQRGFDRFPIIDVDAHHYELESFDQILDYFDEPVLQQIARSAAQSGQKGVGMLPGGVGYQDMGGRVTRYPLRRMEQPEPGTHRDISLARRWMDAMGTDVAVLFPSPMLQLGLHPQVEVETAMARAYNRWLADRVLSGEPRLRSMIYLPFNDPEESCRTVQEFAGKPGVVGFMITSARYKPVHHNAYMRLYAMIEETGLPLGFHAAYNWNDQSMAMLNRFISVHALGFVWHNLVHLTNWIVNGLPERFPKLKVIWIESGLAWLPFLMQRLDHEYLMRSSECPALKRLPSEYMQEMFYTSQPMERPRDLSILEITFRMIKAETQLLYSSDYPHWDFDLPSVIYDLPFLSEEARRSILGGNAMRVFNIEVPSKSYAAAAE